MDLLIDHKFIVFSTEHAQCNAFPCVQLKMAGHEQEMDQGENLQQIITNAVEQALGNR